MSRTGHGNCRCGSLAAAFAAALRHGFSLCFSSSLLIQAKFLDKVRDDIEIAECGVAS